jgi:hypothetical protein
MVAPAVASEIVTICVDVYVPVGTLKMGVAAMNVYVAAASELAE